MSGLICQKNKQYNGSVDCWCEDGLGEKSKGKLILDEV